MKHLIYIIFTCILLLSCASTKYIETTKTEYIHDTKVDSVYMRDSIIKWEENDTVFIYKTHTKFKYINKIDTVIKVDTIPKIVEVKKVVEVNHLYWYQEALMWTGGVAILLLIGNITYKMKFK